MVTGCPRMAALVGVCEFASGRAGRKAQRQEQVGRDQESRQPEQMHSGQVLGSRDPKQGTRGSQKAGDSAQSIGWQDSRGRKQVNGMHQTIQREAGRHLLGSDGFQRIYPSQTWEQGQEGGKQGQQQGESMESMTYETVYRTLYRTHCMANRYHTAM